MNKDKNILITLFTVFFRIGMFTFGGGFAMIPLIEKEIVDKHEWIEKDKFLDAISVTQSVPGAVAINLSIFLGYKIAGIPGSAAAAIGVSLPSFFIILFIAMFLNQFNENQVVQNIFKGVRPAVVGLILYAGMDLSKNIDWSYLLGATFLAGFISTTFLNLNPIILIITVIIIGNIVSIKDIITKNEKEKIPQEQIQKEKIQGE